MATQGEIRLGIGFDIHKEGLKGLASSLKALQQLTVKDMDLSKSMNTKKAEQELKQLQKTVSQVQKIYNNAYNKDLGILNITKFNNELKKVDINKMYKDFSAFGQAGQIAFRNLTKETLTTNLHIKDSHKLLNKMAETLGNTVKWSISSSAINHLMGSIQKSYYYVKDLDRSLNDIRIVTDKSAEDMDRFAESANKAAKNLSASTKDYTQASLIYYQQGLSDEDVAARTETTLKTANVTGQSGEAVSEQLTAVWNGYKVSAEEAELYIDKIAAVAASTASDLEELSTGMSKVASAANAMGVDIDKLNGMLSTVISVTRQAPESAGTAFKTIFARMEDLELGESDEEGATLGQVSESLDKMGVHILDEKQNLRELGDVIEEVGNKWNSGAWSDAQKQALAIDLAGKRQYNNLLALFDNWDMYTKSVQTSQNAVGTLQHQQDIYMESTQAHLQKMKTSWEDVYDSFFDVDSVNTLADAFGGIGTLFANFLDSIKGGGNLLLGLGSIATQVFSKQIANGIYILNSNFQKTKENLAQLKSEMELTTLYGNIENLDNKTKEIVNMKQQLNTFSDSLTEEQLNMAKGFINQIADLQNVADQWDKTKSKAEEYYKLITGSDLTFNKKDFSKNSEQAFQATSDDINRINLLVNNLETKAAGVYKIIRTNNGELTENTLKNLKQAHVGMKNHMESLIEDSNLLLTKSSSKQSQIIMSALQKYKEAIKNYSGPENEMFNDSTILARAREFGAAVQQVGSEISEEMAYIRNSVNYNISDIKEDLQKGKEGFNAFVLTLADQQVIMNVTNMIGAFGRLASAIQAFTNLGNIWSNEDLSTGQKILQTVTSLSFALPSLINGIQVLSKGFNEIRRIKQEYAEVLIAETAAQGANNAVGTTDIIITEKRTKAHSVLNAVMKKDPITLALVAIITAVTAAYGLYAHHVKKAAEEQERLSEAITKSKEKQNEAKEVSDLYKNYDDLYTKYQKTQEGKESLTSAALELADALDIQIKEVDLLGESYDRLNEKIEKARSKQLKAAQENAEQGINISRSQIFSKNFSSHIDEEGNISSITKDLNLDIGISHKDEESVNNIIDKYIQNTDFEDIGLGLGVITGITKENSMQFYDLMQKAYEEMQRSLSETTQDESEMFTSLEEWLKNNEEFYNNYNEFKKDAIKSANEFALIQSKISANKLDYYKDIDSIKDYENYKATYQTELVNRLGQGNKENIIFDEDMYDDVDDYLNYLTNSFFETIDSVKEYAKMSENKDLVEDSLLNYLDLANFSDSEMKKVEMQNYLDSLSEEDLQLIVSIGIDEASSVATIKRTLDLAKTQVENSLNDIPIDSINTLLDSYTDNKVTKSESQENNVAQSEVDAFLSAKGASQEWEAVSAQGTLAQAEYLQDLISKQNEYAQQTEETIKKELEANKALYESKQNDLNQEAQSFAGAENIDELKEKIREYEQAMEKAKETGKDFNESMIFGSKEHYEEAVELVTEYDSLRVSIAEVQDQLNEDLTLTVDMSNVEEILNVGDAILSQSEQIKQAAELIGEGFTVAAEDANKLADVFPAMLDNATVTSEGIIQLDSDVVNELIGGQESILNGDTETAIAIIDNQIAVLSSNKRKAEAELFLANQVAKGKIKLSEKQIDILSNGEKQLADYLIQLGLDENDAQAASMAAMAGNMDEYNRITAGVANDTSKNLAEAMAAAADATKNNSSNMAKSIQAVGKQAGKVANQIKNMSKGEVTDNALVNVEGGASETDSFLSEIHTGTFTKATVKSTTAADFDLKEFQEEKLTDISEYTQAIADLTALKAQLRKNQQDASKALNRVDKGLSGKEPKEKKEKSKEKKEKDPDYIEYLQDESETYHDIDLKIKEINNDLDKVQEQQSKLFGKDLINNLDEQLGILKRQVEAYREKIKLIKMEQESLKSLLSAQGVSFNAEGIISNYYTAMDNKLSYVNSVIEKYNAMSAEEQKNYKKTVESAKKDYEAFKKTIDAYEKLTFDTLPSIEKEIESQLNKEIEIQIKQFTMSVELRLDMSSAEKDFNNFKKKVIDQIKKDDILGNAKSDLLNYSIYYKEDGEGSISRLTQHVKNTLEQVQQIEETGTSSVYGDNKKQALEDLQKYNKELMNQLEEVEDLVDNIKDSFLQMIDEAQQKFEEQVQHYEYINSLIEHDINLIQLLKGEDAYSELDIYYQKQEENNKKELDFQRQQVTFWAQKMDEEEEGSETWRKYKENWQNAIQSLNENVEKSINNLINKYANTIDSIFDKLNNKITNNKGLDYIEEEWELVNQNADRYLDSINAMYETQKLKNKYLNAINNNDSIFAQEKLNNLMNDQLEMLKTKEKLTQYDIDRANALYDIAVKEIALKDAQQNKSKMRLRRDSQGNYSYQFVSDEDQVAQAQQELADAQNALYNMDKNKYRENLDEMYTVYNEFQEKIKELYKDQTLSVEEREERKKMLVEQYEQAINDLTEQNTSIRNNLKDSAFQELANMYDTDVQNFQSMTEEEQEILLKGLIEPWDSGIQKMMDKFAGEGGFTKVCEEAFGELDKATVEYQDSLDELQTAAGKDFNAIGAGCDDVITETEKLTQANKELIDQYDKQFEAIQSVINQMNRLIEKYRIAKNEATSATQAAYKYWQMENEKAEREASKKAEEEAKKNQNNNLNQNNSSNKNDNSSKTKGFNNGIPEIGDIVTYTGGNYYYDSAGTKPLGHRGPGKQVKITYINEGAKYPIHVESNDSAYGWLKKDQLKGFDTGGYTGEWNGPEGKIGILHQKEIVLNKTDTERILSAVNVVRQFDSVYKNLNQMMNNQIKKMLSNTSAQTIRDAYNNSNIEQQISITADFPEAQNHTEIERAFDNILNTASQYAYRLKRK